MTNLAALPQLEAITLNDLEELPGSGMREGRMLEYKAVLGPLDDKAKFELVKDVSAFANSEGGLIIYGVVQGEDGAALECPGVILSDVDRLENQITEILLNNLEDRVPGVSFRFLPAADEGRHFALIRVPRSPLAPHMITMPVRHPRFYHRAIPSMHL